MTDMTKAESVYGDNNRKLGTVYSTKNEDDESHMVFVDRSSVWAGPFRSQRQARMYIRMLDADYDTEMAGLIRPLIRTRETKDRMVFIGHVIDWEEESIIFSTKTMSSYGGAREQCWCMLPDDSKRYSVHVESFYGSENYRPRTIMQD